MRWIVLLLFLAAAAAGWLHKDSEEAQWAKPVLGASVAGVIMSVIGGGVLFYYVMLVALGGVVYCYLQGVKQEKEWGQVGVVGCTGLIVLLLAGNAIGGCEGDAYAEKREQTVSKTGRLNRARMEYLGQHLAKTMSGEKVLFVSSPQRSEAAEERAEAMREAFERGLNGRLDLITAEAAGSGEPRPDAPEYGAGAMALTVQGFDRLIERYSDCGVVVLSVSPSFDFRPSKVWERKPWERPKVIFAAPGPPPETPELMKHGLVHSAVLADPNFDMDADLPGGTEAIFEEAYILITPENADNLAKLRRHGESG